MSPVLFQLFKKCDQRREYSLHNNLEKLRGGVKKNYLKVFYICDMCTRGLREVLISKVPVIWPEIP